MLRRLGIRAKVMAVLAVPMIVLLAAGGFISWNALSELRYAQAADSVITVLQAYTPVSTSMQTERILSLNGGTPEQLAAARTATDEALAAVRPITADLDLSQFPKPVVDQFVEVQLAHNTMLPAVRTGVDIKSQRAQIERNYAGIIEGQLSLMEQVANSLENRDLAQYVTAYREIGTTADNLVVEMIDGIALLTTRAAAPASVRQYATQVSATELARGRAQYAVTALGADDLVLPTKDPTSNFTRMRALLEQGNPQGFAQIDVQGYLKEIQDQLGTLSTLNANVLASGSDVAGGAVDDARSQTFITVGIVVAAVVASLFFALLVSRGIVVPLRRLTKAAADVREQLPRLVEQVAIPGEGPQITLAPIPVTSRDEVGQLAAAFNSVNSTTVQVAQEQAALRGSIAEMFVNVARRDQVLLNRQLSFIDSLERAEEDPSTLANLFRLDHLATRMRRNAESLLVLAGIDSGRRLRDAMPLSDVVRTASSEIEQYDRIELDLQVDPHMHGFNALGAAHLLAELLENATIFSEPETPVTVTTGVSGQFVVVRILDQGLGMSDVELDAANSKIISTSASDSLGNQRLGLFVVGRIAQRLGAEVKLLKAAHGTGTETIVRFPATLFVMTETNLYGNNGPAQLAAPRNDPGMPQIEAPVVEAVDLAALTDGQTSLGLPHRRRRDDGSDEPVGPVPVTELAQSSGLPTRSKKTFDEDNLVLPEAPDGHIAPEISAAGSDWKPETLAPLKGNLPSRSRAATSAWAQPEAPTPAASAAPAPAPAARAGLFSGFRGRTEAAATTDTGENLVVPGLVSDDQERALPPAQSNAVRAPWMSSGAHAAPAEPIVVPQLADEDDSWEAQEAGNREALAAAAADAAEQAESAPLAEQEPVWEPTPAWATTEAPVAETPAWEAPAVAETPTWEAPVWEAPAVAEAPAWEAPAVAETPTWDEPAAQETSAWEAPAVAETPAWDAPVAEETPAWEAPAVAETPAWDAPAAEETPAWEAPAVAEAPAWDEPAVAETPSWDAPAVAETTTWDDATGAETSAWVAPSVSDAQAWDHAIVDDEPAWQAPVVAEQAPAALAGRVATVPPAVPVEDEAAPAASAAPSEVVAPVAPVRSFTSYSGYAGWGAPASEVDAPYQPFERTLDEARAWHTGAMPIVPAALVAAAQPETVEPVQAAEPVEEPVAPADEQAPAADDAAWPAPAWEPPTWQAPEWAEQPTEAAAVAEVTPEPEPEPEPELAVVDGVAFRRVYLEPDPEPAYGTEPAAQVEPEPEVAPEPVAVQEAPQWEPPQWAAPVQEAPQWAPPVQQAPAWPAPQAPQQPIDSPTQLFTPIEAAAAVAPEPVAYAPQAPVYEAPVTFAAPDPVAAPAWAPTAPAPAAPAPEAAFSELVQSPSDDAKGRRRWGLFGRKKGDEVAPELDAPVAQAPAAPEPVSQVAPVRTSAWTSEAAAPQSPVGADSSQSWMASTTWSAPAPAAPLPKAPAALEPAAAGQWSPPEWAARSGGTRAPASTVPQPALPPSVAPRVGTLDDEVAAMLALRSDIQEQALSELSQLSAYRPAATGGNAERLIKRVPTAVPESTISADEGKPVQRDADQLRSRLSSFQSGTSRGRRAMEDPSGPNGVS
ncbi:HAMP domain-containing protein [Cellulomonas humilata]|uniref:histidine kinase n=1 Tax=Cellulomonas humilata TaxID=144055 RepID=A0A7Y6DX38_9CELL|nr:nitrate- and nitrite sensing domain-containing protein [Cellulomonas humilata]NUU17273.1 HAMP domain-containing protein [Cellulomonas humilata]